MIQFKRGRLQIKIGKLTRDLLYSPMSANTLHVCKNPHRLVWQMKGDLAHSFACLGPTGDAWAGSVWHRQTSWLERLTRRWRTPRLASSSIPHTKN